MVTRVTHYLISNANPREVYEAFRNIPGIEEVDRKTHHYEGEKGLSIDIDEISGLEEKGLDVKVIMHKFFLPGEVGNVLKKFKAKKHDGDRHEGEFAEIGTFHHGFGNESFA